MSAPSTAPFSGEALDQPIPLRDLLHDFDATEHKLHCAVWNGSAQPLDVFDSDWDEWVGWNSWRPSTNVFNRRFIFSLIQVYYEIDTWLFGGVFEVVARRDTPHARSYDIELREDFLPGCIGRLKLAYRFTGRNRRLRMETVLDQLQVAEILPTRHAGEPFPGLDGINHTLRELTHIYEQPRLDWRGALGNMKGVYVIHDRAAGGKPYVGSAYGDVGLWNRWGQYVATGHGFNIDLRGVVDREGIEYARQNFVFALLEYWPARTPDDFVHQRESYWKRVLMSREFGYNKN